MQTDPWSYLHDFVEPNLEDFAQRPNEIHLAFNACVPAFQLSDVFYRHSLLNFPHRISRWSRPKDLLVHLEQFEPSFLLIQSIATAYKHLDPSGTHYQILSPGSVVLFDNSASLEGVGDTSPREMRQQPEIVAFLKGGGHVPVLPALQRVVNKMWPQFLNNVK